MTATKKLAQLPATAICGNDITSSCLYVSALTIVYAGQYAWLALLIVAGVLYQFRKIYGEVVGALPLNGGAYNVLLNTTTKSNASVAACLTILKEGMEIPPFFFSDLEVLDRACPEIDIEFIQMKGTFGPLLIRQLGEEWKIPTNFMFISSPGNKFSHHISELHGVRLII